MHHITVLNLSDNTSHPSKLYCHLSHFLPIHPIFYPAIQCAHNRKHINQCDACFTANNICRMLRDT